ncbi:AAA family ATPase [Streptomyces sp. ISL-36]|uniref:AAA family ATPase n=1 Tax=Streptomyces sp. ISL-36 TaxID=2819182 RepID=UPI001BE9C922|nr:LuxR family transcriptional regulator [Streptomyces sp. ISL-36]MBT2445465.1 AAA family ATPase [Streptomyces sp. ISL-36]
MDLGTAQAHTPVILGRDRELARIAQLIDAADGSGPKVLVLAGEPGAGKSTLVERAAAQAEARGLRVLRVRGSEGEHDLAFAGVHQLLHPVLHDVERLPSRQRDALRRTFGTDRAGTGEAGADEGGTGEAGTDRAGTGEAGADEGGTGEAGTDRAGTGEAGADEPGGTGATATEDADGTGATAADGPQAPDPLLTRVGVLTLLSDAATERPLLIAVDDAQWLDVCSLGVLAFVARRLEGERVAVLLAARDEAVPERFDRDFPQLTVGPLERGAAGLLLDAQPQPPRGRARSRILQQAAGNPLALIELARAFAKDPDSQGTGSIDPLPLTARLERLFAADLPTLPPATRRALLLAASAGTARLSDILRAAPDLDEPHVWRPAEQAGLIRVESGHVRLRHPLVRSAIFQAATFGERREAHLALAAALAHEPDRRAWHLAAAALGPDEQVADALEESAERSRRRGGYAAAAGALERAAELTPEPEQHAGRLLAAAASAMYAGYPQWVGEIAARVESLTDDPRLLAEASLRGGWSLAVTLRHEDSLAFLLPVAESMATRAPALALDALGTASTPAYNSGDSFYRTELQRIDSLVEPLPDRPDRLWMRAVARPFEDREEALKTLTHAVDTLRDASLSDLVVLGATAWILDETDLAVRLLGQAMDHLRRSTTAGANATAAQALALALFESGAWTAAQSAAEDAYWMATDAGADNVSVGSPILQATLRAARGDHAGARAQAGDAVRGIDLHTSRSLYVRHCHALGMAALAQGDHPTAYAQFRRAFTRDFRPAPVHYHASLYYLADLAAAAVRAGHADDARAVLRAAEGTLDTTRSARLDAIVHRAWALLSEADDAEAHFRAAVADPANARWPFEYALAHLDFGEWLRRRRRAAEARPLLATALEFFERLDARPWIERTVAELRASGVSVADSGTPDAVADLTPQELQIAQLAAEGLTNRDIGARLYLSPRTIGFHLHKIFPKLGITGRAQLRDVLG